MRIIGIDFGEKRFGVAVSDPLGITAQGLKVIARTRREEDIKQIVEIINEKEAEEIVFGLPKHMNNSLGVKANEVMAFIEQLKQHVDIPVNTIDERLSTVRAHKAMLEANLSRKKRKARVDIIAAQLILQNYLDGIKTK